MPVAVPGAGGRHRDRGPCGVEERVGRRRRAAVVGDLEDVDPWDAALEEDRIDALLDVTGQHEAAVPDLAEQDDGDVVDPGPGVGRLERNGAAIGPQDGHARPRRAGGGRR